MTFGPSSPFPRTGGTLVQPLRGLRFGPRNDCASTDGEAPHDPE
jgi:hypothetical protein